MAACLWCKKELRFQIGTGHVHQQGGAYVMKCPDCGWSGAPPAPSPRACPSCGSSKLRDDHVATPVLS